ncbi:MAG: MBL fold metallo-hydrolase, partial [Dehalococcoidia bacterium]
TRMTAQFIEVAPDIYWLKTYIPGRPTIFSVYAIKGETGILVEPGPASLIPAIKEAADAIGINDFQYIIPTHIHLDHAGAVGGLCKLYPDAQIVVNPSSPKHLIDPTKLIRSTKMAFGDDFDAVYGAIVPVPESRIKVVQDGEKLFSGGKELTFIHTPGHASHHMCILENATGGLFCGEALGLIYSEGAPPLPAVAPPGFDEVLYIENMKKLRKLKPKLLLYSHDGIGYEPDTLIRQVIENSITIGKAILRALKAGKSEDAIVVLLGDYIWNHFAVKLDAYDLESNIKGYIFYYKKQGLI